MAGHNGNATTTSLSPAASASKAAAAAAKVIRKKLNKVRAVMSVSVICDAQLSPRSKIPNNYGIS